MGLKGTKGRKQDSNVCCEATGMKLNYERRIPARLAILLAAAFLLTPVKSPLGR